MGDCKNIVLGQDWNETCAPIDSEELLIRNTFVNVHASPLGDAALTEDVKPGTCGSASFRLRWADTSGGELVQEDEAESPKSPLSMMLCSKVEKPRPTEPRVPLRSAL